MRLVLREVVGEAGSRQFQSTGGDEGVSTCFAILIYNRSTSAQFALPDPLAGDLQTASSIYVKRNVCGDWRVVPLAAACYWILEQIRHKLSMHAV